MTIANAWINQHPVRATRAAAEDEGGERGVTRWRSIPLQLFTRPRQAVSSPNMPKMQPAKFPANLELHRVFRLMAVFKAGDADQAGEGVN